MFRLINWIVTVELYCWNYLHVSLFNFLLNSLDHYDNIYLMNVRVVGSYNILILSVTILLVYARQTSWVKWRVFIKIFYQNVLKFMHILLKWLYQRCLSWYEWLTKYILCQEIMAFSIEPEWHYIIVSYNYGMVLNSSVFVSQIFKVWKCTLMWKYNLIYENE